MTALTADLFESLMGKHIAVNTAAGEEMWRVDSVKRRDQHGLRADQPFNVYIAAPGGSDRKQGLRTATLPDGTAVDFFAVPIKATGVEVTYELVFN